MINTYKLAGMTCSGCKKTVENILKNVEGVASVDANVDEGVVIIDSHDSVNFNDLKRAFADFDQYQISEIA